MRNKEGPSAYEMAFQNDSYIFGGALPGVVGDSSCFGVAGLVLVGLGEGIGLELYLPLLNLL